MARVTHVKRAQQRYEMVPVLDENGQQKRVPVMRKDGVTPKTDKRGREITIGLTVRDYDKPKPMPKCGKCGTTIEVGQPYKWIEPHGRGQLVRCAACPTWQVWEYSSSLSARIAEIQYNNDPSGVELNEPGDMTAWAADAASAARELAEEKEESANNMEEGFGHETSASAELRDVAEQLSAWADELENLEELELPTGEEEDCEQCDGTGEIDTPIDGGAESRNEPCAECNGTGRVEGEEPTEEQMDEWREEAREKMQEALDSVQL